MFATALRLFATRESNIGEAAARGAATVIMDILRSHGPLTKDECWTHCEASGLKSKRHMKLLLRWLKDTHRVHVHCVHLDPKPVLPPEDIPPPDIFAPRFKKKKIKMAPLEDKVFVYRLAGKSAPPHP